MSVGLFWYFFYWFIIIIHHAMFIYGNNVIQSTLFLSNFHFPLLPSQMHLLYSTDLPSIIFIVILISTIKYVYAYGIMHALCYNYTQAQYTLLDFIPPYSFSFLSCFIFFSCLSWGSIPTSPETNGHKLSSRKPENYHLSFQQYTLALHVIADHRVFVQFSICIIQSKEKSRSVWGYFITGFGEVLWRSPQLRNVICFQLQIAVLPSHLRKEKNKKLFSRGKL